MKYWLERVWHHFHRLLSVSMARVGPAFSKYFTLEHVNKSLHLHLQVPQMALLCKGRAKMQQWFRVLFCLLFFSLFLIRSQCYSWGHTSTHLKFHHAETSEDAPHIFYCAVKPCVNNSSSFLIQLNISSQEIILKPTENYRLNIACELFSD